MNDKRIENITALAVTNVTMQECADFLDNEMEVSSELRDRLYQFADKEFKNDKKKQRRQFSLRLVSAIVLIIIVGGAIGISVEASRTVMRNTIMRITEEQVLFEFGPDGLANVANDVPSEVDAEADPEAYPHATLNGGFFTLEYIPEGFTLNEIHGIDDEFMRELYTNTEGEELHITLFYGYTLNTRVEREFRDFDVLVIDVNGQAGYFIDASGAAASYVVLWDGESENSVFQITSNLDFEQLMRVAKGVSIR